MASLPKVYVETTVVYYLAARPTRDPKVSHQRQTRRWWRQVLPRCSPHVSQLVLAEAAHGGGDAARRRLEPVEQLPVLVLSADVQDLGDRYFARLDLPVSARIDAYHLALATWHGMDCLLSWNTEHMVNERVRRLLTPLNASLGLADPRICTPEDMLED